MLNTWEVQQGNNRHSFMCVWDLNDKCHDPKGRVKKKKKSDYHFGV